MKDKERPLQSLKVFLTEDHKCFQIIAPTQKFDGNWGHLISAILVGHGMKKHYGFNIL